MAGLVVAYILSPTVDRLARHGVPRWVGTLLVGVGFILAASAVVLVIVPPLVDQSIDPVARMPEIMEALRLRLLIVGDAIRERLGPEDAAQIEEFVSRNVGTVASWAAGLVGASSAAGSRSSMRCR